MTDPRGDHASDRDAILCSSRPSHDVASLPRAEAGGEDIT